MSKIDWQQIAKDHDMSYCEFGNEILNLAMSYMTLEMEKNDSNEMMVSKDGIELICKSHDI